jgi:ABC-type lipoprotein export system ATPase subunit
VTQHELSLTLVRQLGKPNYKLRTNRGRKEANNLSSEGQKRAGQPHGRDNESRTAETMLETTPANLFEATGLKKHFDDGDVEALRNLNLQVEECEFVAITGPSGCGKTTLLQLLGALDRPTAGRLLYRGTSIPDLPDPSAYRSREIGFIFQAFHLLPTFTALENVQIPMLETALSRSERKDRAMELLKSVGLEQRRTHFPSKLSGGERQRVAIARSLANNPSVLLADEPTGNLDSDNAALVLDLLTQIHQERGMTVVLVTHDSSVAQRASRIIHIIDGHVVSDRQTSIDNFCL